MALWRIRAQVQDDPGRLARLTAVLAAHDANVLGLNVQACHRGPVDEFFVHTGARTDPRVLVAGLEAAGGNGVVAVPADAHELVDAPTKALVMAAHLRDRPQALPQALAELLGAPAYRRLGGDEPIEGAYSGDSTVLVVPAPDGSAVELRRPGLPFTLTEAARAAALARLLADAPAPPPASTGTWLLLPDGQEVLVRPATRDDAPAVHDMHDRCSAESRRLRYFTAIPRLPADALERLLVPRAGITLVVVRPDGPIAAVGSLLHTEDPGCGEVAVLVEDAWQGRGIGTALLRRLGSLAAGRGLAQLRAHVLPGNRRMLGVFDRAGLGGSRSFADGVVMVRVPVVPGPAVGRCA
jgi:GNAT superfamily N-acetyltransferase